MIVLLRVVVLALFATSAIAAGKPAHGHLVLMGGGDKPRVAMEKFIELAGGKDAPIVVVPTASQDPDVEEYYSNLFKNEYGTTDLVVLPIKTQADANKPEVVAAAKRARGVFFGGGDQVLILNALAGTQVFEALREAFRNGAAVAGTSAGTACQSEIMITGEGDFKVIQSKSVEVRDGLGFLRSDVIVDQHFIARQRQNRLLTLLLENPEHLGVGVDEDTAIWVRPDDTFQVLGARSVMVFDPRGGSIQRNPGMSGKELLGIHGMRMHIVLPGEGFDMVRRTPVKATPAKAASR